MERGKSVDGVKNLLRSFPYHTTHIICLKDSCHVTVESQMNFTFI